MKKIWQYLIEQPLGAFEFLLRLILLGPILAVCVAITCLMGKATFDGQFPDAPGLSVLGFGAASDYPTGINVGIGLLGAGLLCIILIGPIIVAFYQRMLDSGQPVWLGFLISLITLLAACAMGFLLYDQAMGNPIGVRRATQYAAGVILLLLPAIVIAALKPKGKVCAV